VRSRLDVVAALLVAGFAAGCGAGGTSGEPAGPTAIGCGPVIEEELDGQSLVHVVSEDAVTYLTDPPTSGPHVATAVPTDGIETAPLARPVQVGLLEQGAVLFQHRDLEPGEIDDLHALAGNGIVVAPNDELPARVVATAWLHKLTCDQVDPSALMDFARTHGGYPTGHE
jgi:hypothetical protein